MKTKTHIKAGPTIELGGNQVEVDEDGFLQDPSVWSEDVAAALTGGTSAGVTKTALA